MDTQYKFTVDGLEIGSLEYPFQVSLKDTVLKALCYELAKDRNISPDGVKIARISKDARRQTERCLFKIAGKSPITTIPHWGSVQ